MRTSRLTALLILLLTLGLAAPATAEPGGRYRDGAPGVGDPYFPLAGNGGIDVRHYHLRLRYTPPRPEPAPLEGRLRGRAVIDLTATQDLRRFNLDLRGLTARAVSVNGRRARFDQIENELRISPRPKLTRGQRARVVVRYGGVTSRPRDAEGSLYGWVTTRDGSMVASEPDGAATWFPVNDHPTDKASYSFAITVPKGLTAVANGLPTGSRTRYGWTTWRWDAPDPMASYLATASVGNYRLHRYRAHGVPIIDAVDEDLPPEASENLDLTADMLEFFEERYGDYPFVSYGAIVDDDSVGYALETQTRSIFSESAPESTVAHELAHQWMGNHVSPYRWADIWLNESWATYSSWLWADEVGDRAAAEAFDEVLARPTSDEYWDLVLTDPGPLNLFAAPIYTRGAATLHALREEIGDRRFDALARQWVRTYGGGTASTEDFDRLASRVGQQNLTPFFDVWVRTGEKPTDW